MTKLDHVRQQVDQSIKFFRQKRNYNRGRVLWLSVATASLSALATVAIAATKMLGLEWLQMVAILATSAATIVGVWEAVFSYRKLWNLNNLAMASLERLKRQIDYRTVGSEDLPEKEVDRFFNQLDRILTDIDREWMATYARTTPSA